MYESGEDLGRPGRSNPCLDCNLLIRRKIMPLINDFHNHRELQNEYLKTIQDWMAERSKALD